MAIDLWAQLSECSRLSGLTHSLTLCVCWLIEWNGGRFVIIKINSSFHNNSLHARTVTMIASRHQASAPHSKRKRTKRKKIIWTEANPNLLDLNNRKNSVVQQHKVTNPSDGGGGTAGQCTRWIWTVLLQAITGSILIQSLSGCCCYCSISIWIERQHKLLAV